MVKIWSELPTRRLKEQVADVATLGWVVFWGTIAWQLFSFLAGFAVAGRAVRSGGQTMIDSGRDLGASLAGLPLVGAQARDIAQTAFLRAGGPLADFGTELEQFIMVVAIAISVLLAVVTLAPWLSRYLPWRLERLRRLRAAHRVIRSAPDISEREVQRLLAMRALTTLEYGTLLEYSPDPFGDFASGRHDRLAKAELAQVGLKL
jgi:hypothetical protein